MLGQDPSCPWMVEGLEVEGNPYVLFMPILLMEKILHHLRMPEMLILSQYQDVFGHPKWCRIFCINRRIHGTGIFT